MSKHTPGPWTAGRPDTRTQSEVYGKWVYGADDSYLAIVNEYHDSDTTMANARLIAAAPELLEACELTEFYARHPTRTTTAEYDAFLARWCTLNWDGTSILDFLSNLRKAAIAKARGEATD